MPRIGCFVSVFVVICLGSPRLASADPVDFGETVGPLLARKCVRCHGPLKQRSKLRVDTVAGLLRGGESGPAVVAGDSGKSLLVGVLTGKADFRMPPSGAPLTEAEIALVRRWIDEGANAPRDEVALSDWKDHWSYSPPRRPPLPEVADRDWSDNPIDRFVRARQEKLGLQPNGPASKGLLLRRLYLDLVGVPPTLEDIQRFEEDNSDEAYQRVVERLLASPMHGERWARHWMDVWRYSDWHGRRGSNEIRYSQYHIWRWRDWIVESLNADKGYDRMVVEMLAGDEVAPGDADVLRATGFLGRNWYKFDRDVWLRETVEHSSMGFLGLTLKCARCHDHKFDPITQKDYYRFRAFFEPHEVRLDPIGSEADPMKGGLARVYDAKPTAPTYLFRRGDDRYPDKDNPLTPGVPSSLGGLLPTITKVELPVEEWYPALRSDVVSARVDALRGQIERSRSEVERKTAELTTVRETIRTWSPETKVARTEPDRSLTVLEDSFDALDTKRWNVIHGKWTCSKGVLRQSAVTNWAMIQSRSDIPENFSARIRYRTTGGGTYNSIGIAFDGIDLSAFQAVYTSISNSGSTVQSFHRVGGKEVYPPSGIVKTPLSMNREILLEVSARGSLLNVSVDGVLKLVYQMPMKRRRGKFAVWNHSGTAEFLDLKVRRLAPDELLAQSTNGAKAKPRSKADFERRASELEADLEGERLRVARAKAELPAYLARVDAERTKYGGDTEAKKAASEEAARTQRVLTLRRAELAFWEANRAVAKSTGKARAAAEKKLAVAKKTLEVAKVSTKATYEPLGKTYPKTSTGRRLALAKWITDERNPRTARVAVNHIWRWHFGKPLVETTANFGLSGRNPTHRDLLDWLASELVASGWSMKHLHRLIVTSRTYRLSGASRTNSRSVKLDPKNVYLWRANWKRMEAEAVRDSVLHLAGDLDPTMGGSDLPPERGLSVTRRSLYFRTTPDDKVLFLELFDLANPNECYSRQESVVPQQALAMLNSDLVESRCGLIAARIEATTDDEFVESAFRLLLGRAPDAVERRRCRAFLAGDEAAGRAGLVFVLLNHNDFVTIR